MAQDSTTPPFASFQQYQIPAKANSESSFMPKRRRGIPDLFTRRTQYSRAAVDEVVWIRRRHPHSVLRRGLDSSRLPDLSIGIPPKFLGVLMTIGGLGFVARNFAFALAPTYASAAFFY
jgi:hypothetical protein